MGAAPPAIGVVRQGAGAGESDYSRASGLHMVADFGAESSLAGILATVAFKLGPVRTAYHISYRRESRVRGISRRLKEADRIDVTNRNSDTRRGARRRTASGI